MKKKTSLALVASVSAMLALAPMALSGDTHVEYFGAMTINDPTTGDILVGLIICEQHDVKHPVGPQNPVTGNPSGVGGACYLDCEGSIDCEVSVNDAVLDPAAWSAQIDLNKDGLTDFECTPPLVGAKTATLDHLCKTEKSDPRFFPSGVHIKVAVFIHEGTVGVISAVDP